MPSASSSSQIYYDSSSDYSTDVDAEGMETLPDNGTDLRMVGIKRFLDKSIISRYEEAAEKVRPEKRLVLHEYDGLCGGDVLDF